MYCGITLDWDYTARTCKLSMPGYVDAVLRKFQHSPPLHPQHAPYPSIAPTYGASQQMTEPKDNTPLLPQSKITCLQQIIGLFYYYLRAVDPTMLVALGEIALVQTLGTATEKVLDNMTWFLNYAATYPNASITYKASGMTLHADSDASYLSVTKARSRVGGHFYLSNASPQPNLAPTQTPTPNAPLHTVCGILRNVMLLAAEAEVRALFENGKEAVVLQTTLMELNHPQPPTPIKTDNSTASGIVNNTLKQRRSKAMDMRFYWVRDRVQQGQFVIYWRPGVENLADYFTKHHPAQHHKCWRYKYVDELENRKPVSQVGLRRCVTDQPGDTRRTDVGQTNDKWSYSRNTQNRQTSSLS